jgi:DNA adenine methylase
MQKCLQEIYFYVFNIVIQVVQRKDTPMVKRPAVRWHGGKFMLSKRLIPALPPHRVYVEPFGGGASVLLKKPRSYAEVYNDIDGEIVNFFRVLRDNGEAFAKLLRLTPYSRDEFMLARTPSEDPLEQARRTVIRSFMGFASNGVLQPTGFRNCTTRRGSTPSADWSSYPDVVPALVNRLQGVIIENMSATKLCPKFDAPDTLFYVDPPYLPSTRDAGKDYKFEMSEDEHVELAQKLKQLDGMVVLSGYPSALYDELYADWEQRHFVTSIAGAKGSILPRQETIWLNPACRMHQRQKSLVLSSGNAARQSTSISVYTPPLF